MQELIYNFEKNKIKTFSNSRGGYETNILSAAALEFILENNIITNKYVSNVSKGFSF